MIQEIMNIINEAWSEHISSWASETVLGLESGIDGKDEFLKDVEERLNELERRSI